MCKKYVWLLLSPFLWVACQRVDLPPDIPGEPVFTTQFTLDNTGHEINAGVEDYYLFSRYESGSAGVLVMSGSLAPSDCPQGNCPGSLTFEFRNNQTGAQVSPDTLFSSGVKPYWGSLTTTSDTIWRLTFSTPDTLYYQSFQWSVDNGALQTGKSITRDFTDQNLHKISLRAIRNGAIRSTVIRHILPQDTMGFFPSVGITVSDSSGGSPYTLFANTFGSLVSSYKWNTGDSTQSIEVHQSADVYAVRVANPQGDTAFAQVAALEPLMEKTADFSYQVEKITQTLSDSLQLGSVNIRWVDENNAVWESRLNTQPGSSYFQIESAEPYDLNENGQKTYKMEVAFSCRLYSVVEPLLYKVLTGTAVIAVAYP
ncbi:MAG: hypothetical protein JNM22_18055 [Saprospiraceae bacterium]|nr:hypothetical protein [Saprospiraceae bacterium]